jgi:CDP-glucose 4,6-dehydratase
MGVGHGALEAVVMTPGFWRGKRVLVTGHTGFKGAWLSLILSEFGAEVTGLALPPDPPEPSLFAALDLPAIVNHRVGDIRDYVTVETAMRNAKPDIVLHLAAQSLVKLSYTAPVETYATNVMGTVHVLEACRQLGSVKAAVVVTSDKCYENLGLARGYHEGDRLGGADPYSNSKACAELATGAYRDSFFSGGAGMRLASARAGNVIGGGDWAAFRLVPDAMRAFQAGDVLRIRHPEATRPWQHVLEPLHGYLMLAEALYAGAPVTEGWNFGPDDADNVTVRTVVDKLVAIWGGTARWELEGGLHVHEAHLLHVDSAKARARLGWRPRLGLDEALAWTVAWYRAFHAGDDMRAVTARQIADFFSRESANAQQAAS